MEQTSRWNREGAATRIAFENKTHETHLDHMSQAIFPICQRIFSFLFRLPEVLGVFSPSRTHSSHMSQTHSPYISAEMFFSSPPALRTRRGSESEPILRGGGTADQTTPAGSVGGVGGTVEGGTQLIKPLLRFGGWVGVKLSAGHRGGSRGVRGLGEWGVRGWG